MAQMVDYIIQLIDWTVRLSATYLERQVVKRASLTPR